MLALWLVGCTLALEGAAASASLVPPGHDAVVESARQPLAVANSASPYTLEPVLDIAGTATLLGALALLEGVVKPRLRAGKAACPAVGSPSRCDAQQLWAFDRTSLDNRSEKWRTVSDVVVWLSLGGAGVLTWWDALAGSTSTPWRDAAVDSVVLVQSVAVAALTTHAIKFAVRRPRPSQYRQIDGPDAGIEDQLSFPSGHTTAVAAAVAAASTNFFLRHPQSRWRAVVAAAALGAVGFTGYARVRAGKHFPSDVVAGSLVGGALGVILPVLHRRRVTLRPFVVPAGAVDPKAFGALTGSGVKGALWGVQGYF